jgi:hypothetical protein
MTCRGNFSVLSESEAASFQVPPRLSSNKVSISPSFGTPFNFVPRLLVLFLFFGWGSESRAFWFLRWPVFLADLRDVPDIPGPTENISRGEEKMVRGARNSEEKRHSSRWYLRKVRYWLSLLESIQYLSVFRHHIGSISILMKALFLSMQIESSKLDPLRFNGSAADRASFRYSLW